MLKLLFVAIFLTFSNGQIISPGKCPTPTPMPFFNPGRFFNYGFHILWKNPETPATICDQVDFTFTASNNISLIWRKFMASQRRTISRPGFGQLGSCPIQGYADLQLPSANINNGQFTVLGTDYVNWAAMYLCNQVGSNKEEYLWIGIGVTPNYNNNLHNTAAAMAAAVFRGAGISALVPVDWSC